MFSLSSPLSLSSFTLLLPFSLFCHPTLFSLSLHSFPLLSLARTSSLFSSSAHFSSWPSPFLFPSSLPCQPTFHALFVYHILSSTTFIFHCYIKPHFYLLLSRARHSLSPALLLSSFCHPTPDHQNTYF